MFIYTCTYLHADIIYRCMWCIGIYRNRQVGIYIWGSSRRNRGSDNQIRELSRQCNASLHLHAYGAVAFGCLTPRLDQRAE